jgi:hypothetical protein
MRLSVYEVRSHLLACVHRCIASGAPYVDAAGEPQSSVLYEQLKVHAVRHLDVDLRGAGEIEALYAVLTAALARHDRRSQAAQARDAFKRREIAAFLQTESGRRWQRATQAKQRRQEVG